VVVGLAPKKLRLGKYSNPFNTATAIRFDIPNVRTQYIVSLKMSNVYGNAIETLINEK